MHAQYLHSYTHTYTLARTPISHRVELLSFFVAGNNIYAIDMRERKRERVTISIGYMGNIKNGPLIRKFHLFFMHNRISRFVSPSNRKTHVVAKDFMCAFVQKREKYCMYLLPFLLVDGWKAAFNNIKYRSWWCFANKFDHLQK